MGESKSNNRKVEVDAEVLIAKGKQLADLPGAGGGLFDILNKLSGDLARLGTPWGDDELGDQFAEGKDGYLTAKEGLIGNAGTGPDAQGAIPIYGQLLINYGRSLEEAGKRFSAGEDLFADWILKNYVNEDAKGDPGPYTGPLSSDPNHPSNKKNQVPPPGGNQDKDGNGPNGDGTNGGGGPQIKSNGGNGPDIGSSGLSGNGATPDLGGMNPSGPESSPSDKPPFANLSSSSPNSPFTPELDGISNKAIDPSTDPNSLFGPGTYGPGLSPYDSKAIDPVTGKPVDKSGLPIGSTPGKGGAPLGNPLLRPTGAFDGEKLANKSTQGANQSRAGIAGTPMMPGTPGAGSGVPGGASTGDTKDKRRERRKDTPAAEEIDIDSTGGGPWTRAGWRNSERQ
ncbi:hypothetical protein [Nocardia arizonensis]|uniref:hypothetical protein n=1 Tax=Nocardia arizonensis TaxID=1141647 RepID=UPI0006D2099C|nr:hypothetical protein [Nocardia arizonensis]